MRELITTLLEAIDNLSVIPRFSAEEMPMQAARQGAIMARCEEQLFAAASEILDYEQRGTRSRKEADHDEREQAITERALRELKIRITEEERTAEVVPVTTIGRLLIDDLVELHGGSNSEIVEDALRLLKRELSEPVDILPNPAEYADGAGRSYLFACAETFRAKHPDDTFRVSVNYETSDAPATPETLKIN